MSATKCSKDTFTITHTGITGGPQVDFTKIAGFDLTKPYTTSGTFNPNDLRNPEDNADQGISGLSVWARDPILPPSTTVTEPGMLALFGAGMLSMAALRRRRHVK